MGAGDIASVLGLVVSLYNDTTDGSVTDDALNLISRMGSAKNSSRNSIQNMAKNNICQFPVLVSSTISLDSYSRLANMLEELYATYLKMTITNCSDLIDLGKGENKATLINKIHQNDNFEYDLYQGLDDFGQSGVSGLLNTVTESTNFISSLNFKATKYDIIQANKILMKPYNENFNLGNLNGDENNSNLLLSEAHAPKGKKGKNKNGKGPTPQQQQEEARRRKEQELREQQRKREIEARRNRNNSIASDLVNRCIGVQAIINKYTVEPGRISSNEMCSLDHLMESCSNTSNIFISITKKFNTALTKEEVDELNKALSFYYNTSKLYKNFKDIVNNLQHSTGSRNFNYNDIATRYENGEDLSPEELDFLKKCEGMERDRTESALKYEEYMEKKRIKDDHSMTVSAVRMDNRISKNNDLEPTILQVDVAYTNKEGRYLNTQITIGVKTISHVLPYEDFVEAITESLIKRRPLFRAVQWLTGEIKTGTFLFDIDNSKKDATSRKYSTRWWKHLQSRSKRAKQHGFSGANPLIPNATFILSPEDIAFIKATSKIDLLKDRKQVLKLMDIFFLMNFVILDDVNEELLLFNTATQGWEHYTFAKLDKEVKNNLK